MLRVCWYSHDLDLRLQIFSKIVLSTSQHSHTEYIGQIT